MLSTSFFCKYCKSLPQIAGERMALKVKDCGIRILHHPNFTSLCEAARARCHICVLILECVTTVERKVEEELDGVSFFLNLFNYKSIYFGFEFSTKDSRNKTRSLVNFRFEKLKGRYHTSRIKAGMLVNY